MMAKTPRILMISSAQSVENVAINKDFAARLGRDFGGAFTLELAHFNDIAFIFEQGKPRAFLIASRTSLADFGLVYLKSFKHFEEHGAAIVACLRLGGTPFIGEELGGTMSLTKLSQYARLTAADFPVPKAMFVPTQRLEACYARVVEELGTPFVLKDIGGHGGELNFLVQGHAQLAAIVAAHAGVSFVAQQFIANSGDVRALVIGGKAKMIIGRARLDDSTHLNNTSQGAKAMQLPLAEFGADNVRLAENAAALFEREIAGVDIMFEAETGKAFVLEVNACPQVASGAFVDEKTELIGDYLAARAAAR